MWSGRTVDHEPTRFETCQAVGCDRKPRSTINEYCEKHYYRLRRTGTVNDRQPAISTPCANDECDRDSQSSKGYCRRCLIRFLKYGDPNEVRRRKSLVGYGAVHSRLAADRGPATRQRCVDCGGPAGQWSYDHEDPDELWSEVGPYSLDLDHYDPRCVSCHKTFDLGRQ